MQTIIITYVYLQIILFINEYYFTINQNDRNIILKFKFGDRILHASGVVYLILSVINGLETIAYLLSIQIQHQH